MAWIVSQGAYSEQIVKKLIDAVIRRGEVLVMRNTPVMPR